MSMAPSTRRIGSIFAVATALTAAGAAMSQDGRPTVRVKDFGAEPDSRRNATADVRRAMDACRKTERPVLVFPKGRSDF